MIKSISYERQFIRYLLKRFAGILAGRYGSVRLTYIRTSRYGQFPMSRQNSHIYFLWQKKTLSNTDNGHCLGPSEQIPINLTSYYRHCGDQVNPKSRSGESAQGEVLSENPVRIDTEAGGGGGERRKGNLSVCKPMKGMKILSKGELQYLPMETSWTYCLVDHQLLF